MRKRPLLIAVPLCVLAVVAFIAVAAPGGAEQASDAKLDKLHAKRPIAASSPLVPPVFHAESVAAIFDRVAAMYAEAHQRELTAFFEFIAAEEEAAAQASAAAARSARASSTPRVSGDPLACIRHRESRGDYSVHSSNGLYHGAYQFLNSTWNSVAASEGRDDLVGVDPASASAGDQDAMASALYAQRGSAPWGGTC